MRSEKNFHSVKIIIASSRDNQRAQNRLQPIQCVLLLNQSRDSCLKCEPRFAWKSASLNEVANEALTIYCGKDVNSGKQVCHVAQLGFV